MSGFQTIARSAFIKSIQRGSIVVATGVGGSATASITSVNPALAEIFNLGAKISSANTLIPGCAVDLLNATTVIAYANPGAGTVTVFFQVTEHYS
jgi:hypothetical protein